MMKTRNHNEKARMINHMTGVVNDLTWVRQHNQAGVYGQVDSARHGEILCQAKEIAAMDIQERDYSQPSFTHSTKWIEPGDLRHVRRKEEITTHT